MEEKLYNIAEIISAINYRGVLYSPLLGSVDSEYMSFTNDTIIFRSGNNNFKFDLFGHFKITDTIVSKEIMIFPSEKNHDWETMKLNEGDVIISEDDPSVSFYVFRDECTGNLKLISSLEGYTIDLKDINRQFRVYKKYSSSDGNEDYKSDFAINLCRNCLGGVIVDYLLGKNIEINLKVYVEKSDIVLSNGNTVLGRFYLGTLFRDYQNGMLSLSIN